MIVRSSSAGWFLVMGECHTSPCMSSGSPCLLSLPTDILVSVLQQPGIGARELCRLESCAHAFLSLIDDSIWRAAFLAQRRCNALHEPVCWKQEFARREKWSRDWRRLTNCAQMPPPNVRLSGHTQKLRRFALKMMSSTPYILAPACSTHIVDNSSKPVPNSVPSIAAALHRAKVR